MALVVEADAGVDPCHQLIATPTTAEIVGNQGDSHGQWWSIWSTQRLQTEQ